MSQLREKADDFAENLRKSMEWASTRRVSSSNRPDQANKSPLIRSPSADAVAPKAVDRFKLEKRRSSAYL